MAPKRTEHPLALMFWSQFFLAYALPAGLEIIYWWRHGNVAPGHAMHALIDVYPFLMVAAAVMIVLADGTRIYVCVARITRRLPGIVVGAIYALFAFVSVALVRSGDQNAGIAWADYVTQGSAIGIIILLLALAFEIFAVTFLLCQGVTLARRWRRLGRTVR